MRLSHLAFFATSLFVAAPAFAGSLDACDLESSFDLSIDSDRLVFEPDAGAGSTISMSRRRLSVDGREVDLSAADRERLLDYEASVRELVPEVKAIALDAVEIASEAMMQVANTFAGGKSDRAIQRLRAQRDELRTKIEASTGTRDWDERAFEDAIETMVGEVVPMLVGDITASAVAIALSGDESAVEELEQRAKAMERAIEENVERRAEALEARAEALCPQLHALEAIERSFEARLPDGSALDLVQVDS